MPKIRFAAPGSVKTLRRYWKDKISEPTTSHLFAELGGESDRAYIILITSLLDDALCIRLMNHISQSLSHSFDVDDYDHVFRDRGPLGSFSSRIDVAYWFGLIDARLRCQLDDLRELRNACAHSKREIDLGLPEFTNVAARLFAPNGCFAAKDQSREAIRATIYAEFLVMYKMILEKLSRQKARTAVANDLKASLAGSPP